MLVSGILGLSGWSLCDRGCWIRQTSGSELAKVWPETEKLRIG